MLELNIGELVQWMTRFLWPLFRIAAFFMVVPMIGTQLVPARVRLTFALVVALVVAPLLPPMPVVEGLSFGIVVIVAQQLLIGFALGFMVQVFFHIFVLAGQLISTQMGLGFASVSDPSNGVSVVVVSQFYLMLTMMLFLSMNGHLVLVDVIVDSFRVIPVGMEGMGSASLWMLASTGGWMFASALVLALPALIALLIVNFAFGIMTKASPQLNIFAIGFPFTMLFGLFITWVALAGFLGQYQVLAEAVMEQVAELLRLGGAGG
ncbi:flagellar biosynthetic protein FliR [Motiliproteus sp. SC1-56]|uniref:flagellar biosynthetic protein FliR n=1 Tax=Motiliproteus sp. SC1-56 TaxID=2799565 RepID=UPI001A8C6DFD|nr:flagellar biosynthetic protein FliR [Motiliproteus sp. SC1-56]